MAAAKKEEAKVYIVKVSKNPTFCGIGAGGVQFANGQAIISEGTMVNWFKEHAGYEVKEANEGKDE